MLCFLNAMRYEYIYLFVSLYVLPICYSIVDAFTITAKSK